MPTSPRVLVRHDAQNFGPYSVDEVNSMLVAGRVLPQDLGWIEGTPQWEPLAALPGVRRVPPMPLRAMRAPIANESERLILPAFLLAFFLGVFGVHRFYVGKTGSGLCMLLLTLTGVGLLVTGIWHFIDWIVIVCGGFRDDQERLLRRWV